MNGNILAPQNTLVQTGGVNAGLVIVADIVSWTSGSQPSCTDLQEFTFVVPVAQLTSSGATSIPVNTFSIAHVGDKFTSSNVQYEVVERKNVDGQDVLVINKPLESSIAEGSFIQFRVNPNQPRNTDTVKVENNTTKDNSGSAIMISFVCLVAALLF